MAVTVKTGKTLKLKTAKTVPAAAPQPSAGTDQPQATIAAAPVQAPAPKGPSYVLYGILGLLSVIMFIALLLIQWMEYSEYKNSGMFPTVEAMLAVSGGSSHVAAPSDAPASASDDAADK